MIFTRGAGSLCASVCIFLTLWIPSHGANWFEGLFQGTPCFQGGAADSCDGSTLMENFPVDDVPRRGSNDPDTRLFLFTRRNKEDPEFIHDCGGLLSPETNFNPAHPTVVIIHGWTDGACRSAWMREYKYEYLRRGEHNVILVDWSWGNFLDFAEALDNIALVGRQVAWVLTKMVEQNGLDPAHIHMIGHNFGAHACGVAAQFVDGLIGRITGLDPGFPDLEPEDRLDPSDAAFIDVIHTGGGFCPFADLSNQYDLGHAEFYPNGGKTFSQFSCVPYILVSILKLDWYYAFISLTPWTCANLHAIQYYKSTICPDDNPVVGVDCDSMKDFSSKSCRSCGEGGVNCCLMGEDAPLTYIFIPSKPTRKFYLKTGMFCSYVKNNGIDYTGFELGNYIEHDAYGSCDVGGSAGDFLKNILNATGQIADFAAGGGILGGGEGGVGGILEQILDAVFGEDGIAGSILGGLTGDGGPLGSILGEGGPLGSLTGEGGPLGSLTGEGGPLGSITGILGGGGDGEGGGDIISTVLDTAQGLLGGLTGGGEDGGGGLLGGLTGGGGGGLTGSLTGSLGGGGGGGLLGGLTGGGGGKGKGKGKKKGGGGLGGLLGG